MLKFQIKKDIKNKKYLSIIIFSLIMTIYTFVFLPATKSVYLLNDELTYKIVFGSLYPLFEDSEIPEELENQYKIEVANKFKSGHIKDKLRSLKPKDKEYFETKQLVYKIDLEEKTLIRDFIENNKEKYPELVLGNNTNVIRDLNWDVFKYKYLLENNAEDPYDNIVQNGDNFA